MGTAYPDATLAEIKSDKSLSTASQIIKHRIRDRLIKLFADMSISTFPVESLSLARDSLRGQLTMKTTAKITIVSGGLAAATGCASG